MKIKLPEVKCLRCGKVWTPRQAEVRMCPRCKSVNFDKPKPAPATKTVEMVAQ